MSKKIELQGLKGLDSLSNRDYQIWRQQQIKAGKLTGKNSFAYEKQLYANQQFVKRHGEQAFKALNKQQRDSYEQAALKAHNDNLIRKTVAEWANPFNEDGTVDPNKGVGDANLFYKIMAMDPLHQKELYESDWKTNSEMDKLVKETVEKHRKDAMAMDQDPRKWMGRGTSAMPFTYTTSYQKVGQQVDETILRGDNTNIYDKIFAKDVALKEKQAQPQIQAERNSLNSLNDEQMNNLFIETIFPKKGKNLGIPQLAAYFNEDGTIKSDEVENMSMDEKRDVVAKYNAYQKLFGASMAYDLQDKEAKDYISEHQDWGDKAYKFGADFAVATAAYTADMMNGARHLWIEGGEAMGLYNQQEVECYVDANGRYLGRENVDPTTSIYTDPYSGEQIPVTKTTAKRSVLDYHGIAPDGTSRRAVFNNRYWSDAEATGSFSQEEHAQAKALNGYSPNKMVYKMGEDQSYLWEIAKMGSFAMADMALAVVPGGVGLAGKGIKTLGTMGNVANTGRKALKAVGTGLEYTSKALNEIKPFYASVGMSHMMGRGTLDESLTDNLSAIDNLLRSEGEKEYQKIMGHQSLETGDLLYNREMESKQANLHNKIDALAEANYNKWKKQFMEENEGKDPETALDSQKIEELKKGFKEAATREFAETYVNDYVEQQKTTDRYKQMVDKAAETAADAAFTLATTTGIQYGLVNAWGYRRYLYKDPTKRIQSSASKRIKDAFTDANTGKLTVKSIYDGVTKGQNIANFAKVGLSQMAKEGIEQAVDELHTYGAKQINEDAMSKYLNNEFSADAEARTYSMWEGMSSYFLGATKGLYEAGTYESATVGALSGGFNVTPNVLAITSPGFRERWKKAREEDRSWLELTNMLVNNGVLNTYFDEVEGEREAKRIVETVNQMVDKQDQFKALSRGLAMNQAKLGDLSPDEEDALDFMKATQIINQLQEFSKQEAKTLLGAAAQRSDVFKEALDQVEKITSGKFTEQDAKAMLTEYYRKNSSVSQTEENSTKALEQIKENATKLKKGVEIVNQVNGNIDSYEKKTGKKVNPLVRAQLSERMALDQFLEERVAENEEKISGNRAVNTQRNAASYGTREGVKNKISDLDHAIGYHTDVVDTAKQQHAESKKELDEYLESIKDAEELTSAEQKKLAELTTKVKAAELEVRIAETDRNKVVSERNSLIQQEESWEDGKVMSKEEILAAHPEDRARMLDPNNINNYSEEQQIQIQEARNEILRKEGGKEILEKIVPQQRKNVHTFSKNKESLASIMEDPEAALVNMLSSTSHAEVLAAQDRHNTQVLDAMIKQMESNPDISPEQYDNAVYQTLLNNPSLVSGVLRHKRGTAHTKYGHVVQKAVKAHNILDNVKQYIKNNTEVQGERVELLGTAINILQSVNTEEEFIERLGEITDSPNIAEETKDRLRKLLESLEEVYQHQSKATRATKEQKEKAQKEKEAKKQAEEAERLKREEEIIKKKEEEKKRKEEEKAQKEKEIAERRAAGISEEDEKVDNESKLTPEQIAQIEEEGEDIELESPTLEEQVQADNTGDVDKRETPTNDTSTADAVVDTLQDDTFLGNMLYRYDAKQAAIGIREKRQGRDPGDPMSRRFAWFENEGIKLQEIIDSELHHLVKLGVKLHPLTINPQKNATDDEIFKDDVLWVVEYTDKVKKVHNEKLGGVITANGKQYLIVGQAGFDRKNTNQFNSFNRLRNKQKAKRNTYFKNNSSERFYVDESSHTKVKSISSGRLITRNSSTEQVQDRPVTELLEGDSNPRGNKLDIEDLKWCISHGDEMATVNVAEEEQVRALKNRHPGATYLLVEAADGKLTPASIKPAFLSELRDSALKDELNTAINSLADHNHAERVKAVNLLSEYLYLAKGKDQILVGSPSQPVVKIYRNGTELKSFDLNSPNVRTEMLQFITEEFNPRINIVANKLKNASYIEKLAEAGALDTDIILLGTCNASYTVYAIDEDGNPEVENIIDSSSPDVGGSDLFDAVATDVFTTTYQGKTAVKDSNGNWKLNGKRVTDYSIISQLEFHEKLAARNLQPIKTTNEEEVYLMNNDTKNPVFYIKRGDHIRKVMGDEAKQLLKQITEEQEEKARQKRIEEAQRQEEAEANGVDIKPENKNKVEQSQQQDKPLTDEEIMQQQLGNFESGSEEKSVKQQKAEDTVAKILADSENLELTEDENFYRDTETGELYARVTSIESADVNAKPEDRFDPNNPYATPSTSIGNGVDEFIRDFFDDTLGDVDSLSERYPNATTADLQKLLNQLNTLKQQLNSRGIKIVSKGIKAIGTVVVTDKNGVKKSIKVAGTLDLLGYDSDGNFYVFDVKTNRSMPDPDTKYGKKKLDNWAKQTSLYKEFLEKNYNIKVKALEVIPVKVHYPTPVGASDRQGVGNITYTKDSKESNQLQANGQEYRDAKPYLFPNIPLKETSLDIRYEKLLPHEQKIVMDLAESKNTPSAPNTSQSKQGTPIVNDVNNANRSLADLQNDDKLDNAENILYSEYYEEVTALLQQKAEQLGWPYPENTEQYIDLLVQKDIAISNITNVEDWLDMIRDCKH